MQSLKISHIGYNKVQQIVKFARHQITFKNFRYFFDSLFKCEQFTFFFAFENNVHKNSVR